MYVRLCVRLCVCEAWLESRGNGFSVPGLQLGAWLGCDQVLHMCVCPCPLLCALTCLVVLCRTGRNLLFEQQAIALGQRPP